MKALGPLLVRARRLPRIALPRIALDGAIGAGIFAIGGLGQLASPDEVLPHSQRPAALGLLTLACLGAALRRTNLWAACILVLLAAFGGLFAWNDLWGNTLPELALLYAISERRGLAVSVLALMVSSSLFFVVQYHQNVAGGTPPFTALQPFFQVVLPYYVLAWFTGRAQARRLALASELDWAVAQLSHEREWLARNAITAERSRIARDLHALVVRGIQRMNADIPAAREMLQRDPSQSSESVGAIESAGRGVLVEMRRLLNVLRTRDDIASPSPLPPGPPREYLARSSAGEEGTLPPLPTARRSLGAALALAARWSSTPKLADALLVLVLAIMAVAEPLIVPWPVPLWPFAPFAIVAVCVLLVRRHFPRVVLAVVAVEVVVSNTLLGTTSNTVDRSMVVAVFTVAALRGLRWGIVALGIEVLAYAPLDFAMFGRGQILWPYDLAGWSAYFLFALIGGIAVRNSRRLNEELRDQTELLQRTREERIRLALVEERSRIARDVHDLVAHGVTLMVIQAGAARWLAQTDPAQAHQALGAVERAGQKALRELASLVGSLDRPTGPESVPHVRQLTFRSLVKQETEIGTWVDLVIDGEPRELDGGLELALYRIVQEALTNVRKHAPGARVRVAIRYTFQGVEVEVTDSGGGSLNGHPRTVPGAGQGLVGIAERAALFGGHAEAVPTPGGGFRVRASLHDERVLV